MHVHTRMHTVFFMDAVEHITRIARILRQPRGNAMLVGVGGSGKSSLTRFATCMGGFKIFSVELTRGWVDGHVWQCVTQRLRGVVITCV